MGFTSAKGKVGQYAVIHRENMTWKVHFFKRLGSAISYTSSVKGKFVTSIHIAIVISEKDIQ